MFNTFYPLKEIHILKCEFLFSVLLVLQIPIMFQDFLYLMLANARFKRKFPVEQPYQLTP